MGSSIFLPPFSPPSAFPSLPRSFILSLLHSVNEKLKGIDGEVTCAGWIRSLTQRKSACAHTHTHTHIHTYIDAEMQWYAGRCVHMHTHTHTHSHTHTHTHRHTHSLTSG